MPIDPDDPWLFERLGFDWRWLSWREAAARIAELSAVLAALEPGSGVGFDGRPSVASVLADCAVMAAGLTAMPAARRDDGAFDGPEGGARFWLPLPSSAPRLHPPAKGGGAPALPVAADLAALPASAGAVIEDRGRLRRLATADLAREARRLSQRIGVAPARDITVLGAPLGEPLARRTLAWALAAGAAIVTEPDPPAFLGTAAWARPTVLAATGVELVRWTEAASEGRGGPRSPLGRLRAWLVPAEDELPPAVAAFWRQRGAVIVSLFDRRTSADRAPGAVV